LLAGAIAATGTVVGTDDVAKQRLDTLLVELNLCSSRQLAQRSIRAGEVMVDRQIVDKPGTPIAAGAKIEVKARARFVSRGGEKLAKALEYFAIDVGDRVCLDGGISTGGFTDCLLQAGAKCVYGIDVGYGQLDWGLRTDPRVVVKERTNLRYLTPADLYTEDAERADFGVADLNHISLTKVLSALWDLLVAPRELVLLVKPQFEVGRSRVGKKGVVRDPDAQADAICQVAEAAREWGWRDRGLTWSPITGAAGNIEYLLWLSTEGDAPARDRAAVGELTAQAHRELQ
jgi:23S rRNA (cytidine1920-2'-O)/16S rRNA (cytidine1409-2'-O)-methyltransferase